MSVVENAESHVWSQVNEILSCHLDLSITLNWTTRRIYIQNLRPFNESKIKWLWDRFTSITNICGLHWNHASFMGRRNTLYFLWRDKSCIWCDPIKKTLHLLIFFEICAKEMHFGPTFSWAVFWTNIIELWCFVPIVDDVVIRVILIVQRDVNISTVNFRRWCNTNCLSWADYMCFCLCYPLEHTKCIVCVHSLSFRVIVSIYTCKISETTETKLNNGKFNKWIKWTAWK